MQQGWQKMLRHLVVVLALWAAILGAYSNTLGAGFGADSPALAAGGSQDWPLRELLHGSSGFNAGLHAANALLVYLLGLLIFTDIAPAALVAALWGLHPALTAAVTDPAGRPELVAAFGVLAGSLCWVRHNRAKGAGWAAWLAAATAAGTLGFFAKQSAVVLLAAVALWDLCFEKTSIRARLTGYAVLAAPMAGCFWSHRQALAKFPQELPSFLNNPLAFSDDFLPSQLTSFRVIARYLGLLIMPAHLSVDYSYNAIPLSGFGDWKALSGLAICAVAVAAAIRWRRGNPPLAFCALFFFVALAPGANLIWMSDRLMSERLLYLAAVGFAGCGVVAIGWLAGRWGRQIAWALAGAVCLLLAARTYARNFDWRDDFSLWSSAARSSPESARAHAMLAQLWLARQSGTDRAVEEAARATAIVEKVPDDRNSPRIWAIAAAVYRRKGESVAWGKPWYEKAAAAGERAQAIDRLAFQAYFRANDARHVRVYVHGEPDVYLELGRAYLRLAHPDQAVDALSYGVALDPRPDFFLELFKAYRTAGANDKAAEALIEGTNLQPQSAALRRQLVDFYQEMAPGSCALQSAAGGLTPDPACPMVHEHLCTASLYTMALQQRMGKFAATAYTQNRMYHDLGCQIATR